MSRPTTDVDARHLDRIAAAVVEQVQMLTGRREEALRVAARHSQLAMDRDEEIRRIDARLRVLRGSQADLCLGRIVPADGSDPIYIGRIGLSDSAGERLLVDWRSPAAGPFFSATGLDPCGIVARRRYRWSGGHVIDYWDEVFGDSPAEATAALEDVSAFVASLGAQRTDRMRDVLGTLQADQHTAIRAAARGALVVDGGPGTGKTVVALHRAAYLLHTEPRLARGSGGVLVIGPHDPYLAYVGDVLPGLGEDEVTLCTIRDLVPEGVAADPEPDDEVARLKATSILVDAIEPAVALYEDPPTTPVVAELPWADVRIGPSDWADAFAAVEPGTPHNEARAAIWAELAAIVGSRLGESDVDRVEVALRADAAVREALHRAWPIVEATDLVADLWEVPAYLRRCAPTLSDAERRLLRRDNPSAWTVADLPLLDAARRRLGDPDHERRRRRAAATLARQQARMDRVVDELIQAEAGDGLASSLRQDGMRAALQDAAEVRTVPVDDLAGPFAHVVVDEAQELTDAEWRMVVARCPSRSLTIVGDRAQARHGFTESWETRLARLGLDDVRIARLTVNYRTPAEIMAEAAPVIRDAIPDANVPTSIRSTGIGVEYRPAAERDEVVRAWGDQHREGTACVIGDPTFTATDRVASLPADLVKGLEFDLVLLQEAPAGTAAGITAAVDRYVAMTRATQRLVILRGTPAGRR